MKKLYTVYDHHTHKITVEDATINEVVNHLNVSIKAIISASEKDLWLYNRYEFCVEEYPDEDIQEVKRDRDGYLKKIANFKREWDSCIYRASIA